MEKTSGESQIAELKRDFLARGFLTRQMSASESRPEEILEQVKELAGMRQHTLSIAERQAVVDSLCKR